MNPTCALRRRLLRRVGALILASAAGSAPAAGWPLVVRDDRGREHRFAHAPRRIVTMLPSLTETVWVLGGGARLVGVDRYSDWPAAVERLSHLGGLDDAQIEAIAALEPDLILASISSRAMDRLEALGFAVVRLKSETYADVHRSLDLVARLLGDPHEGERVWARVRSELAAAAARLPAAMRGKRVYFEIGGGPYAAGTSSFIGQTLAQLGLVNIVPAELGPFPKLNPEFVVRARPDVIMGVEQEVASIVRRPGWGALAAVRDRQLCGFPNGVYELVVRPGPRLGEAAAAVVDCLVRLDRGAAGAR